MYVFNLHLWRSSSGDGGLTGEDAGEGDFQLWSFSEVYLMTTKYKRVYYYCITTHLTLQQSGKCTIFDHVINIQVVRSRVGNKLKVYGNECPITRIHATAVRVRARQRIKMWEGLCQHASAAKTQVTYHPG